MGTGKTEVGRVVSKRLGLRLVDIDITIEKEQGMTVTDIFSQLGEQRFREMEAEVIKRISDMRNIVVSTGGGAVLRQENLENLRKHGVIVCLTALPETILKRVGRNSGRPLLDVENPLGKVTELLQSRKAYYEKADIIIDTEARSPLDIAEEIIKTVAAH